MSIRIEKNTVFSGSLFAGFVAGKEGSMLEALLYVGASINEIDEIDQSYDEQLIDGINCMREENPEKLRLYGVMAGDKNKYF